MFFKHEIQGYVPTFAYNFTSPPKSIFSHLLSPVLVHSHSGLYMVNTAVKVDRGKTPGRILTAPLTDREILVKQRFLEHKMRKWQYDLLYCTVLGD